MWCSERYLSLKLDFHILIWFVDALFHILYLSLFQMILFYIIFLLWSKYLVNDSAYFWTAYLLTHETKYKTYWSGINDYFEVFWFYWMSDHEYRSLHSVLLAYLHVNNIQKTYLCNTCMSFSKTVKFYTPWHILYMALQTIDHFLCWNSQIFRLFWAFLYTWIL